MTINALVPSTDATIQIGRVYYVKPFNAPWTPVRVLEAYAGYTNADKGKTLYEVSFIERGTTGDGWRAEDLYTPRG